MTRPAAHTTGLHRSDTDTRVAVIIACFNHGAYVREAVASVWRQDWPHVECVLVDDGSTDRRTLNVIEALGHEGVRVVRQENRGLPAARNAGVRATETPVFVCLDADDRLGPRFLSRLLPTLLGDPAIGYCYSWTKFFGARSSRWACPDYDPKRLLVENLSPATAVVRRAAFDRVGGYRQEMIHGYEDWDLWLALLAAGFRGACVPETLFYYRKHPPGRSMLDRTHRRHREIVRSLVARHRRLYASQLGAASDGDADILPLLTVEAQLNRIETSGPWRLVERISRAWPGGSDRWAAASRRDRLDCITRSLPYRLIVAAKKTPFYEVYARRVHGPTWKQDAQLLTGAYADHRPGRYSEPRQ